MYTKTSTSELDYTINWDDGYLGTGENVINSVWTIKPTGLTVESTSLADKTTSIILSGGTHGVPYKVLNTITTNNTPARTDERVLYLIIWNYR